MATTISVPPVLGQLRIIRFTPDPTCSVPGLYDDSHNMPSGGRVGWIWCLKTILKHQGDYTKRSCDEASSDVGGEDDADRGGVDDG